MTDDRAARARSRRASGTMADFDGAKLSLARRLRRMPRTSLAAKVSVSAAAVTQFEKSQARPTTAAAAELALALGVSPDFFRRGREVERIEPSTAHFRSLRSTPAISRDQALAFSELALATVDLLEQYIDFPPLDLHINPVEGIVDPMVVSEVASETRRRLGVSSGPVGNVVRLLESHGVLVFRLPNAVDNKVDAFSATVRHRAIILLSQQKDDRARSRFDAAHELGHLVMHPDVEPGSKLVEGQAHAFASEFLAPSAELLPSIPRRIDWSELQRLKAHWGISLRALAFRAHEAELWSDATYRRSMQILHAQGYPEPGALGPPESPYLVGAATSLLEESGISLGSVALAGGLPENELRIVVEAGSETRPRLHIPL